MGTRTHIQRDSSYRGKVSNTIELVKTNGKQQGAYQTIFSYSFI